MQAIAEVRADPLALIKHPYNLNMSEVREIEQWLGACLLRDRAKSRENEIVPPPKNSRDISTPDGLAKAQLGEKARTLRMLHRKIIQFKNLSPTACQRARNAVHKVVAG